MRMVLVALAFVVGCGALGGVGYAAEDAKESLHTPTHKQVRVIRPHATDISLRLNTFALSPEGHLWMCCSPSSGGGRIVVVDAEGEAIRTSELEFAPQAINFAANGTPFVAGGGKVARLTREGKIDLLADAPNLFSAEEMEQRLRKRAQVQVDRMVEGQQSQVDRIREQVGHLEKELEGLADDEAGNRLRTRNELRLKTLKQQMETLQSRADEIRKRYEEMFARPGAAEQVKRATGLSVTDSDVFVSLPSWEGFGYAIYRMTHDLTDPQIITDNVGGCCGQLDIQSDGKHVLIAMNTAFKVGTYDREGKSISSFGERKTAGSQTGWGSCCNPMNIRCLANGEILIAESSIGHIKRYTPEGEYLGLVGTARIGGGCKHVAIAMHPERNWYFMMNTSANNIAVLVPNEEAPEETDEEREARLAMQGLGAQLIGAWKAEPAQAARPRTAGADANGADDAIDEANVEEDAFDFGQYIVQQNRYLRLQPGGKISRTEPAPPAEASSGGFLSALGSIVTVRVSQTRVAPPPEEGLRWIAIKQEEDAVYFALEENEVRSYVAKVRFREDDKAEFQWFYDEPSGSPLATVTYRRVAGPSEEDQACLNGTCDPTQCTLPDCKHKAAEVQTADPQPAAK